MKKSMLVLGMISGMGLAYMMFNKSARKMVMNKMECMLNKADKMLKDTMN